MNLSWPSSSSKRSLSVPAGVLSLGLLLGLGLLQLRCENSTVTAGVNEIPVTVGGQCAFPRACYVVAGSGPLQGQCADCRGGPSSSRLGWVPMASAGTVAGGTYQPALPDGGADGGSPDPSPTEPVSVCKFYTPPAGADVEAQCALPETLCVARGPKCTAGSCVRAGGACATSPAVAPQRKPGAVDQNTYCPYTDDVCCPGTGVADGGTPDAGVSDAAGSDAK